MYSPDTGRVLQYLQRAGDADVIINKGQVRVVWNRGPELSEAEVEALIPQMEAFYIADAADLAQYDADKAALREQVATALTRLQQIQDAASPTTAQVVAAVRDLALYMEYVIKALRRIS
jgi:hypothetical protein